MLLDLENFKEGVGSLRSTIFLLVTSQHLFDILFCEICWVDTAWDCVIRCKLVLNDLMLEVLWEKDHHAV